MSFILHEDEHLLVVNKPAGWNTHSPTPFAGEGIYEWLKHREPRWATLAIVQRLDQGTSGVLVFGKTPVANRSLTTQFAHHTVRKKYLLLTDRAPQQPSFTAVSSLVRAGDRYLSRPLNTAAGRAETRFCVGEIIAPGRHLVEAQPVTGRTHQIRVHAAEHGLPICGDKLYGGTPSTRLCLHAAELTLRHPATNAEFTCRAEIDFSADIHAALRAAIIDPAVTNAYRIVHGAADAQPGWYVDRLADFALVHSAHDALVPLPDGSLQPLSPTTSRAASAPNIPASLALPMRFTGVYHRRLQTQPGKLAPAESSPQLVAGALASPELVIRENGVRYAIRLDEGYSTGLFLDQRDNRRRLLTNHVAANFPLFPGGLAGREVLNTFAYTCAFSVCAARAGARATSLDLSQKYLEWGRRNFAFNELDLAPHDFIYGDVFNWLRRFARRGRAFDVILLDPPTFSRSKSSGTFQAARNYGGLVSLALPLLKPGGVLFACSNAATLSAESLLKMVTTAVTQTKRRISQQHYAPQPPDFPVARDEPAHLKTVWLRLE